MEKIKNIYLHQFRNDEHFQFIEFALALVKEVGAAALRVEPQNTALVAVHREEDEALKKIMKSALTAKINEADRARDGVFRGMADAARSGLNHFDPKVREAAVRVGIVMDTYGNVNDKSHVEETSAIYNLLKELTEKHADDCPALGLVPWITEVDRRNGAVADLLERRADEGAERTSLVLKEVRARVDDAYYALAAMVEAQALVAMLGSDPTVTALYAGFVRRLDERIDMMNHTLAQRRGIAAAKRAEEKAKKEAATEAVRKAQEE